MAIESRVAGDRPPAIQVRPETPQDFAAIRRVHRMAFGEPSQEADLVDALLDSDARVLALGPMAVVPAAQRRGAGSALMRESLRRAGETDYPLVVVVGHPEYYPRFGFERGDAHDIRTSYEVSPEAWMVLRLPAYRPAITGLVAYPDEFGLVS